MSRRKTILLSLLLSLPVILFVLQQYFEHGPNLKPTGFTLDENVLYMFLDFGLVYVLYVADEDIWVMLKDDTLM